MNPIILISLALLAAGIAIIVIVQRSSMSRLVPWLAGAGLAGSLLSALYVFMNATVPIAPYETGPGAWTSLYWSLLMIAFAGFGLGVILVSIFAVPIAHFRSRRKAG